MLDEVIKACKVNFEAQQEASLVETMPEIVSPPIHQTQESNHWYRFIGDQFQQKTKDCYQI